MKSYNGEGPADFQHAVFSIFNFTANSYSWYINMYIGLFIISPLLNAAIKTLERKKLLIMICTLILITALPATFNPVFNNVSKVAYFYFPDWWAQIYPIVYYLMGAYIAKYKIGIKKAYCVALIIFMIFLQTILQILANRYVFDNWVFSDYHSIFIIVESLGLFLLFYSSNVKNNFISNAIKRVSTVTLEIFLFSNITDFYIYQYFRNHFYGVASSMSQEQIFKSYFLIIIPLTFLSSFILSIILNTLYNFFSKCLKSLIQKIASKKTFPQLLKN